MLKEAIFSTIGEGGWRVEWDRWFDKDFIGRVIGTMEQNAVGVRCRRLGWRSAGRGRLRGWRGGLRGCTRGGGGGWGVGGSGGRGATSSIKGQTGNEKQRRGN